MLLMVRLCRRFTSILVLKNLQTILLLVTILLLLMSLNSFLRILHVLYVIISGCMLILHFQLRLICKYSYHFILIRFQKMNCLIKTSIVHDSVICTLLTLSVCQKKNFLLLKNMFTKFCTRLWLDMFPEKTIGLLLVS